MTATVTMSPDELRDLARLVRLDDLELVMAAGQGHLGSDYSCIDILTTLYLGGVLRVDPSEPDHPERDRFVLSKGHTAGGLYCVLARAGFFPHEELSTFLEPLSALNGHPNRRKVPGVETNTGPLGHGFPVAVGIATAAQVTGADRGSRKVDSSSWGKNPARASTQ